MSEIRELGTGAIRLHTWGDSVVGSSFPILGLSVTLGNALPTPRALVTSPGSARLLG